MTQKATLADRILEILTPKGGLKPRLSAHEITARLGVGYSTVTANLRKLLAAGLVVNHADRTWDRLQLHDGTLAVPAQTLPNLATEPVAPITEAPVVTVVEIPSLAAMLKAPLGAQLAGNATAIANEASWVAAMPTAEEMAAEQDEDEDEDEDDPAIVAEESPSPTEVGATIAPAADRPAEPATVNDGPTKALKPGSIAEMVMAHMTEGAPLTPYEIGKAIKKSSGAVANACRRLATEGRLSVWSPEPLRYMLPDPENLATVVLAPKAPRPASLTKRERPAPTPAEEVMHTHPVAVGRVADEGTYLRQHPMIEVYTAGLTLADNQQDCEETIGKRTVRYHDYLGTEARHQMACAVVGTVFEPDTNHARLEALDDVTAPWGGRKACGDASISWSHNHTRLADCDTWMQVTLPRSISAILSVDGNERRVVFLAETHNDSSRVDRFHVAVRSMHTNTAILLRGTSLDTRGRHTRRSLRLTKERIAKLAAELPGKVAAHADALRAMAGTFVDADELLRLALVIVNHGRDVFDGDGPISEGTLWERAIALFDNVHDAIRVPRSPLLSDGLWTAYAIFEAAAQLEALREYAWDEYARKLVMGETYADVALRVLRSPIRPINEAITPGLWNERRVAAEQLPALDPMPEGHTVDPWIKIEDVRLAWCTALAPDATTADERIDRLMRITDPLLVLSIVAPYVPVRLATLPVSDAWAAVNGVAA